MASPFDSSAPDGSITTTSRIRVWFLTKLRGYRVYSTHRLPKQNSFGEIYYRTSWILVETEAESAAFDTDSDD